MFWIIILLFVIIIFTYYFYFYKNKYTEPFSNESSSLSIYYPDSINGSVFSLQNYLLEKELKLNSNKIYIWNGIWKDPSQTDYTFQFLQNNDKLIITILNTNLSTILQTDTNNPANTFSGYAQLDPQRYKFTMSQILFNNLDGLNTSNISKSVYGHFNPDNFIEISLKIKNIINNNVDNEDNTVNDEDNNSVSSILNELQSIKIQLTMNMGQNMISFNLQRVGNLKIQDTSTQNYLNQDMYVNPYPLLELQEETSIDTICKDNLPKYCNGIKLQNNGITDGKIYSGCITSTTDCSQPIDNPSNVCIFNNTSVTVNGNAYSLCPISSNTLNLNTNYLNVKGLASMNNTNLDICSLFSLFKFSSYIIFYVSSLKNVQTLGYSFFGTKRNESSVVVEPTTFSSVLYDSYIYKLIENWKKTKDPMILQKLIILSGNPYNTDIISKISNLKYIPQKSTLETVFWNIQKSYTSNSCTVNIQTNSDLDNQVQKCIDTDMSNNGTPFLNLFEGGTSQELFLENLTLLEKNDKITLLSTDIRTRTSLYLEPSFGTHKGFHTSDTVQVNLRDTSSNSGTWLILGTPISSISTTMYQDKRVLEESISSLLSKSNSGTPIGYNISTYSLSESENDS